jgi:hypothetical protein
VIALNNSPNEVGLITGTLFIYNARNKVVITSQLVRWRELRSNVFRTHRLYTVH